MNDERRWFGTDGIRGTAGREPMSAEFAFTLGLAVCERLRRSVDRAPLLAVGMDTRRSGPMLAHALVAGFTSRGGEAVWLGVVPTPGVSYLTTALGADAGAVVSASHNPFDDNGIKFFSERGEKLPDAEEAAIEADLARMRETPAALPPVTGADIGAVRRYRYEEGAYRAFLLQHAPFLDGMRVGLDCANGAAANVAPDVFRRIGARLDVIHAEPDGVNINDGCGSTAPESLIQRVRSHDLEVGVTFDGDADRALLVDRKGRLVRGDRMLAIVARVRGDRELVTTVMGNLGVERWLRGQGVTVHRTRVGDRYVHEALKARGLRLGGEPSGHLLFLDKAATGDGVLSALQVLSAVRASNRSLEAWMDEIPEYPQRLRSVRVAPERKASLANHPEVQGALRDAETELGERGRVNVRPSGTEPLVRVMVEGEEEALVERLADQLASVVEAAGTPSDEVA